MKTHTLRGRTQILATLFALGLSGGALAPSDALGCGGCFAPPATVQVVTDHRMVLSVSPTQTTLWDQFRYSGRPGEFSWILPIRYTEAVRIGLADDRFMQAADNLTAPVVTPPTPRCGFPPSAGGGFDAAAAADAAAFDSGVVVHREEVVGPYAVAIIGGTDPMAIRTWLTTNGYTVPDAVSSVIAYYTDLRMDFVALRLRPGEGVDRMSPVRVTVPGNMPSLPLRMISAGVADSVGLSLVILASTRMEAMNFPNGAILASDLTYDFAARSNPATDFLRAFEARNRAAGGRLWLTESSGSITQSTFMGYADGLPPVGVSDAGASDIGPVDAAADVPDDVPGDAMDAGAPIDIRDDIRTAYAGLGDRAVVTRMRANLSLAALDRDLTLTLSDMGPQSRYYTYGTALHDPCGGGPTTPPVDAGPVIGPRTDAGVVSASDGGLMGAADAGPAPMLTSGGIQCATDAAGATRGGLFGLLGVAAMLLQRRRSRG